MLQTVIRNLIINFLKFTNSGGEIIISGAKDEREVKIFVSELLYQLLNKNLHTRSSGGFYKRLWCYPILCSNFF